MISLFKLFENYGIDPATVRLVRHGNKEIDVLEVFQNDLERFTQYTAWQRDGKYGDSAYLAVFAPAQGTTALFLGLWRVNGITHKGHLTKRHMNMLIRHDLPLRWFGIAAFYHIEPVDVMADLSERLVIDWGHSTLQWVQRKDKQVVQIKPPHAIGEFISYDAIQLDYDDLCKLTSARDSNVTWVNALSSVNGVYLIRHRKDGRLYVGSAYGDGGILGRWAAYARSGHGGNKLLKQLDPRHFEFSVLEIAPSTMSADDVIARENRWKERLGTRQFGLNEN